jgi:hydroxylysine kinase
MTTDEVVQAAQSLYGLLLTRTPKKMNSTTDDVYLLEADRRYILRVGMPTETRENATFQNGVLGALARQPLGFAVPTPLPSTRGELIETIAYGGSVRYVRLMSYVAGHPVSSFDPGPALLDDVGASLARLHRAMASCDVSDAGQEIVWSVDRAMYLRPSISALRNEELRALVTRTFANFEENVLPRLATLRRQIIHSDFNPFNVLVESIESNKVSGVIDFGDMTSGPVIQDLAVAASRHCNPHDPVPRILDICAGYATVTPIRQEEAAVLFDLICLRSAVRVIHWTHEAAKTGQSLDADIEANEIALLRNLLNSSAREVMKEHFLA